MAEFLIPISPFILDNENLLERLRERAAIMQHDGALPRAVAERQALAAMDAAAVATCLETFS